MFNTLLTMLSEPYILEAVSLPDVSTWSSFRITDLFDVERGRCSNAAAAKRENGSTILIGAANRNNGQTGSTGLEALYTGNKITVGNAGDGGAGYAFYQPFSFTAISTVNVLTPKFDMSHLVGIFIAHLITLESFRYNHGRSWSISRMSNYFIKLPTNSEGSPNWEAIQLYMQSLPYSKYLA